MGRRFSRIKKRASAKLSPMAPSHGARLGCAAEVGDSNSRERLKKWTAARFGKSGLPKHIARRTSAQRSQMAPSHSSRLGCAAKAGKSKCRERLKERAVARVKRSNLLISSRDEKLTRQAQAVAACNGPLVAVVLRGEEQDVPSTSYPALHWWLVPRH